MFEKVNPCHPDKVADRIAGAVVDLCYTKSKDPKVACEVLIGHGYAYVIAESSVEFRHEDVEPTACKAQASHSTKRISRKCLK